MASGMRTNTKNMLQMSSRQMSSMTPEASSNIKPRTPLIALGTHLKSLKIHLISLVQPTFITIKKRDIPLQHENQDRNWQTWGATFQGHTSSKPSPYHSPKEQKQNFKPRETSPNIKPNWRCDICKKWNVSCNRDCNICQINQLKKQQYKQQPPYNPPHSKGGRY